MMVLESCEFFVQPDAINNTDGIGLHKNSQKQVRNLQKQGRNSGLGHKKQDRNSGLAF